MGHGTNEKQTGLLASLDGTSDEHKVGAKIFRNAELVFRFNVRVCQIGWVRQPWARNPKTPHFYWLGLRRPGPPNFSLLSTGPGPARPPKSLTFIDGPWASPAHLNPSLSSTGPWASASPHFYWPDPSLLSARPGGVTPALPQPALPRGPPERPPPISPGLGPSLFGKPSHPLCQGILMLSTI